MSDMLVKLYDLPPKEVLINSLCEQEIVVRRCFAMESEAVIKWVEENFGHGWVTQCKASFENRPVSCHIAVKDGEICGFGCYDAVYKNIFGPTAVKETYRGKNIGTAILLDCMYAMVGLGYGYAIIGDAGPIEYYSKTIGATVIENSSPGLKKGVLR